MALYVIDKDGNKIKVAGAGAPGKDGTGIPAGGTAGQVLAKKTDADQDVQWKTLTAADVGALPVTGGTLTGDLIINPSKASARAGGVELLDGLPRIKLGPDGDIQITTLSEIKALAIKAPDVRFELSGDSFDISDLKTSVSEGKALIASAVTDKGVDTSADASFQTMHDNILAIPAGGGSDFAVPLTVTVDAGATVTAKNGDIVLTAIAGEDNTAHLTLTAEGDWVVSATLGEKYTSPKTVKVAALSESLTLVAGILTYYGAATDLSKAGSNAAKAIVGDYALFAGFAKGSVDAYSPDLTRTSAVALSSSKTGVGATTVGNYALFAGGYSTTYDFSVDAYDKELTRTSATRLSEQKQYVMGTKTGNYGLFGGGSMYGSKYSNVVEAYDETLTRTTATNLRTARAYGGVTSIGEYGLFGGGLGSAMSATVDAYDTDLTRTIPTSLSAARSGVCATTIGEHALFGGGGTYLALVDAYRPTLTRTAATDLSVARSYCSATTIGEYAIFCGGLGASSARFDTVDAFTQSLTRTTVTPLSVARSHSGAITIGEYALIAGGTATSGVSAVVDAYTIE